MIRNPFERFPVVTPEKPPRLGGRGRQAPFWDDGRGITPKIIAKIAVLRERGSILGERGGKPWPTFSSATVRARLRRRKTSRWTSPRPATRSGSNSRLLPMDVFWKVIRDEIKAAKAVVVIWSARAIDSEWVYAEAKLAHDTKKLVCVRTPDVPAIDIPMPFNGYNVTPVDERPKIYEALTKFGLKAGTSAPLAKAEMEVTEVTVAWGEAKASGNPKLVEAFIRHYRDRHPFFAELAETFLAELPAGRGGMVMVKPAEVPLPQAGDVFLRIEPGMHTAMIRRIGVDEACTLMATGSDDKTARLWALPEGGRGEARLLRTLRVPIGEGDDGKVFAVALSPDGQWVAAGGSEIGYTPQSEGCGVYLRSRHGPARHPPRPPRQCDRPSRLFARWQPPCRNAGQQRRHAALAGGKLAAARRRQGLWRQGQLWRGVRQREPALHRSL